MSAPAASPTSLDPAVEEMLEGFDESAPAPPPSRERVVEYAAAAAFLATAVPMAAILPWHGPLPAASAIALVAAYAVASRVKFAIGYGFTVPTQLVFVPMLLLLPAPLAPLLVAAATALGNVPDYVAGRTHPSRALLVPGDAWHAVGPALVLVLAGVGGADLADWPIYLAALGAQFAFDAGASTAREWLALGISPRLQPGLLGWVYLVDLLLSPIGLLAALAAAGRPGVALLTLPLVALLGIFATERRSRLAHALELSRAYRGTTLLLGDVLEAEDEYTGAHSRGVVSLSLAVADAMGLAPRLRRNVEFGALLHDVGKIAVPNEILNKPAPLTEPEWTVIKAHTIEGQRMLDRIGGVLSEVGRVVRSSHERWDGGGYPDGLAGEEIPLESAIVSCCDAYHAMTSGRPYKEAIPPREALAELRACAGTQFSPAVVDAVAGLLEPSIRAGAEPQTAG